MQIEKRVIVKVRQGEQKEIGRIKLSDDQDLVTSIADNKKLHLRAFVRTNSYTGATKRGLRFYLSGSFHE